jgi:uncharacterized metal-binding protein YceD (DUF177 family)
MTAPWSHPVGWSEVGPAGLEISLTPDARAAERIARHLGVERIERLSATLQARPWLDGVAISGRLQAAVTRLCGITLEPFEEPVDETFDWRIVPEGSPNAPVPVDGEFHIDLEAEDPPDVVAGQSFDVADHVVEQLALSLDPFPRKPDAVFEPPLETGATSPFAVLAKLEPRRPPDDSTA